MPASLTALNRSSSTKIRISCLSDWVNRLWVKRPGPPVWTLPHSTTSLSYPMPCRCNHLIVSARIAPFPSGQTRVRREVHSREHQSLNRFHRERYSCPFPTVPGHQHLACFQRAV